MTQQRRDIIVIGASAGGFEALKTLIKGLPADLPAAVFVVWHMSPEIRESVLPYVLNKIGKLPAASAVDGESVETSRIYVAPPDFHLLIENDRVRLTRGPKENRFRPAVDPLFRSAAQAFGARVVGVVLSGALDDGTAGLWTIKFRGGLAVVQDPLDAEFPSMPRSALREVAVDYCVSITEMPALLMRLARERATETVEMEASENEKLRAEIRIAAEDNAFETGIMKMGDLTPFTCPECHGVLVKLKNGNIVRFRCHTGHAFSADSLLTSVSESIEDSIWSAMRALEESIMLLRHMGSHLADREKSEIAEEYFQKARDAEARAQMMRQTVISYRQLNAEKIRQDAAGD